jgi:uncharacterized membrane protein (DUF106 family)
MGNSAKGFGDIWKKIELVILALGFGVLLLSLVGGMMFRDMVAGAVNVIISPITTTMPFHIVILVMAIIVTVCSSLIQKYTMDWDLVRRVQEKGKVFQKEFREAQLSGNKHKMKKLEEDRMAMMEEQASMSKQQLKPLAYVTLISLPLFVWAFWYLSQPQNADLSMTFPFWGTHKFIDTAFIFQWWIVWSIICSLSIAQVIRKAFNVGV